MVYVIYENRFNLFDIIINYNDEYYLFSEHRKM